MTPGTVAIGDHAAIGDGRSAALVARDGSVDWLCWPRFDSAAIFAGILDPARGGHFRIAPNCETRTTREYLHDTNVLVTRYETANGLLRVTDLMPVADEPTRRRTLRPEHELLRIVECDHGEVPIVVEVAPRPDFGRRKASFSPRPGGLRIDLGCETYNLVSTIPLALIDGGRTARAEVVVRAGERVCVSLTFDAQVPVVLVPFGKRVDDALDESVRYWRAWAARCRYDGPHRDLVVRGALALKLLSFAPSGAIVAAATTSLPERIGGSLNWDYRFCWPRDASLTMRALLVLGHEDEASAFGSWLLHATRLTRPALSVLYDVYGRQPGPEVELDLAGYGGSRPVRVGNAASRQVQLDIYGEVVDAVAQLARAGARIDRETSAMLVGFGHYVCEHGFEADAGIWEPRTAPAHHTHSRVLAWKTLDCILALHQDGRLRRAPVERFNDVRAALRRDVEDHAWNSALSSYTQTLGGDTVDASLLLMSWYGFHAPGSPRARATYELVRRRLEPAPGLLFRYEPSRVCGEGAFAACGFWAAEYLAHGGGSLGAAEACFAANAAYANDVGLFAEQIDPIDGASLGNFPQAYTHVALIGAALALEERRRSRAKGPVTQPPLATARPLEVPA